MASPNSSRSLRVMVLANKGPGLAPGQRFRFESWAPRLERDHGITLDLIPFESPELTAVLYQPGQTFTKATLVVRDLVRRREVVGRAQAYDAVLICREGALLGPAIYERLIARTGVPIVFDFDDSIWSPLQEMNNGIFSRLHFFGKTKTLCRIAAAVTPGSEFLADYARRFNDSVIVMPTSIELDDYPKLPERAPEAPFTVCWTGSTSTLANFEHAREPLERLAKTRRLTVKVICNQPPSQPITGAENEFVPWSASCEAQEIADCHVGIMPLPDDEVARGKCGLKALQYMATGRPVVISPVGMNRDLVRHGENGLFASSSQDFVDCLEMLARSPELRLSMGDAGRRTIEADFSAEKVAAKFAEVIRLVTSSMDQASFPSAATPNGSRSAY